MTPEDDLAFRRMREAKVSVAETCRQFNIGEHRYYETCKRLGLPITGYKPQKPRFTTDPEGGTDCPKCVCGGRLHFQTNGFGLCLEVCWSCGAEHAIRTKGQRIHDQRERLEAELASLGMPNGVNFKHIRGRAPQILVGKNDPQREVA